MTKLMLDELAQREFGMTRSAAMLKGICVKCHELPKFYTEAGRREYGISGLCEPCFDELTKELENEQNDI